MKKKYTFFLFLMLTISMVGQNKDFVPTSGVTWSEPNNWSPAGIPTIANNVRLPGTIESDLDIDFTLSRVQTVFGTGGNGGTETAIGGSGVLTIDTQVQANVNKGINNLSGNGINLIFKGSVVINNTAGGFGNTLMTFANETSNQITFADGSTLTINTPLEGRSMDGGGGSYNFEGVMTGAGALRFNANGAITFGSTSDNSSRTGDIVWVGANTVVTVNTADNGVFVPSGQKVQSNADNGTLIVNGANVYKGSFGVDGSRSFTFDVNANQNSMENITFTGAGVGNLNIDIDSGVSELFFADNSVIDWKTGTVNITGYKEGVLRFGTDANGLTAAQLSQITVDGSGGAVALNSNGYLVNASSLSVESQELESLKPIAYPTIATSTIFFSKPQSNVKVFDVSGRMVLESQTENQSSMTINSLNRGVYLIVFDNKKLEKFIKQ